jgi:hypothetical protein
MKVGTRSRTTTFNCIIGWRPTLRKKASLRKGFCTFAQNGHSSFALATSAWQVRHRIGPVPKATPKGDKLEVSFVSFSDGRLENEWGKRQYDVDQPLFAIARGPDGLVTTCQGYKPTTATASGVYKDAR